MRLTKCCIVLFKFFTTTDLTSLWVVSTILLGLITCSVVLYSNLWSQYTLKLVFRWLRWVLVTVDNLNCCYCCLVTVKWVVLTRLLSLNHLLLSVSSTVVIKE